MPLITRPTVCFMVVALIVMIETEALFWGSSSEPETTQRPQFYAYPLPAIYHQRYIQANQVQQVPGPHPLQNVQVSNEDVVDQGAIPAIPMQVPLQAQFTPIQNLHNVQLVPCLCPVSPNVESERNQEQAASRVL